MIRQRIERGLQTSGAETQLSHCRFFLEPAAGVWRERSRSVGAWVKNIIPATFGLGGRAPTSFFVGLGDALRAFESDEERRRRFTAEVAETRRGTKTKGRRQEDKKKRTKTRGRTQWDDDERTKTKG